MKQDQHALIEQIRVILQQGLSQRASTVLAKEHFLPPRPRNLPGRDSKGSAGVAVGEGHGHSLSGLCKAECEKLEGAIAFCS